MRIGIIQMSDLHISSASDFIVENVKNIVRSCKSVVNTCNKLVVVVSGDIIDKGNVGNYTIAEQFFNSFKDGLYREAKLDDFTYVLVPGNHDIDFSVNNELRSLVVDKLQKRDTVEEERFIEECLKSQEAFWNFFSRMNSELRSPCISYSKSVYVNDRCNLVFHCYNTAFISTINEKPGTLIVPENFFIHDCNIDDRRKDVVVSVFHHNTGWLSTNTANNNKKIFEKHIEETSNVLMCGHEHQREEKIISDLNNRDKILYLESNSMQQGENQSFNVLVFSDEDDAMSIKPYEIVINRNGTFKNIEKETLPIIFKRHSLSFTESYNKFLSSLDAPITHPVKKNLTLDDIFVYPDLEPLSSLDNKRMYTYIDSSSLLIKCSLGQIVFLEGEAQSGKTSLLKMLVRQCYQEGVYPLFVNGDDFKIKNMNGVLREAYTKQYVSMHYDKYLELDKVKRCIFIDNIDRSVLNQEGIKESLKKLLENFAFIVATSTADNSVIGLLQKSRKDDSIKHYLIHQLGHLKRNQLIEKWLLLGVDKYSMDYNLLLDRAKLIMEQFANMLGKQLLPSNPIFLLIILQEMSDTLDSYDVTPTSYANLYQGLLMSALHKQGVSQNDFDGIIQFLSHMAYSLYQNRKGAFRYDYNIEGEIGYIQFYENYKKVWNLPITSEKLLNILKQACLLVEKEEGVYSFAYKYVYFYLVGKYIASLKNEDKVMEIRKLCGKLYKEENGNILIFMAYLNNDLSLIEEIKFASWLPFEDLSPITLDRDDKIYQQLTDFVQKIKNDVLRTDVDCKEEQLKELRRRDELDRAKEEGKTYVPTDEDYEKNSNLREINDMIKANKIIGQVIKNQRDILKKDDISTLLADAYLSTFRVLSFFTEMLEKDRDLITNDIIAHIKNVSTIDKRILTDKIDNLLRMMLLRLCYNMFATLASSVGTSGISEVYDKVSKDIVKSPAADIITFTIKSYYEPLKEKDLQEMMDKYKKNPVVLDIVRARVRSYVYNHNLGFQRVQRLGDISGLVLLNSAERSIQKKYK